MRRSAMKSVLLWVGIPTMLCVVSLTGANPGPDAESSSKNQVTLNESQVRELPKGWKELSTDTFTALLKKTWSEKPSSDSAATAARDRLLIDHAWTAHLAEAPSLQNQATIDLIDLVAARLSAQRQRALLDRLDQQVTDEVIASLGGEAFARTIRCCKQLGAGQSQVASLAVRWMDANARWRDDKPQVMATLLGALTLDQVQAEQFSVRWTGTIEPRHSEKYTFITLSDDGVRLWVDGKLIIDNWTNHPATVNRGDLELEGGRQYPIRVEYYDDIAWAGVELSWESKSQRREVVPAHRLRPEGGAPQDRGLLGEYFNGLNFAASKFKRVDPVIHFQWGGDSPAQAHAHRQAQVAGELWRRHLSRKEFIVSGTPQMLPWLSGVAGYLTTEELGSLSRLLAESAGEKRGILANLSMSDLWELMSLRRKMSRLPEAQASEVIAAWARANSGVAPLIAGDRNTLMHYEYWFYHHLSCEPGTGEQIPTLEASLVADDGTVRLGAAQVLAWVHRHAGRSSQWKRKLDQQLADPAIKGDALAGWLMARAYAEEISFDPENFLAGSHWLEKAVAAAKSPTLKTECVRRLTARYAGGQRPDRALELLDEISKSGDSEKLTGMPQWREGVALLTAADARARADQERRNRLSHRSELERRLQEARKRQDREGIQRYERLLAAQPDEAP